MQNKNIWGKICDCGKEVSTLVDEHPFGKDLDFALTVKCGNCGREQSVSTKDASDFFKQRIFDCFKDVKGDVLEVGSGGGLITNYLALKKDVKFLAALDKERADTYSLKAHEYYRVNLNNFDEQRFGRVFDYVVCRDVLMYLDDMEYTLSKLARISKNMILLNWFDVDHRNCINKTSPEEIVRVLKKYFKTTELKYLNWYRSGYLIKASNKNLKVKVKKS